MLIVLSSITFSETVPRRERIQKIIFRYNIQNINTLYLNIEVNEYELIGPYNILAMMRTNAIKIIK